jgi:DNA-binding transcriptional LysR family regulator
VPLFERLPRGVRLTAAGEMMLAQIRRMHQEFGAAVAQVDALKGMRRGHVRIGVLQYMSGRFVPELILDVPRDHPGLSYTVQTGNSAEIVDGVVRGDLDIGMCWTNSIATIVALLVAGAGISVMTRMTVQDELARGALRTISTARSSAPPPASRPCTSPTRAARLRGTT